MKKNKKNLIIMFILVIIAIIIVVLIYNNKKKYSNFILDSDSKYILTTNMKNISMQKDGGSHTNDYYQIDFDNNQVIKCQDKYVGFKGYEYKGKIIYTKNLNENEVSELNPLIDGIIAKKDDEQEQSDPSYNYYTLSTIDYEDIKIYDESLINEFESILSLNNR